LGRCSNGWRCRLTAPSAKGVPLLTTMSSESEAEMAMNRLRGTQITRASARSILSCALLWIATVVLAAAQTNQPLPNIGSVPIGQTSPNSGSVSTGTATTEVLHLTLRDAINRAVRNNLGQIESGENARIARGQRLRALSALLPQVTA